MPPFKEGNQEPASERSFFCGSLVEPIEYQIRRSLTKDPLWNARWVFRSRMTGLCRQQYCGLGFSLGLLLGIIERMYRLNLSVYDVNPVENVIHSFNGLHVEDGCNVISVDDVLL